MMQGIKELFRELKSQIFGPRNWHKCCVMQEIILETLMNQLAKISDRKASIRCGSHFFEFKIGYFNENDRLERVDPLTFEIEVKPDRHVSYDNKVSVTSGNIADTSQ